MTHASDVMVQLGDSSTRSPGMLAKILVGAYSLMLIATKSRLTEYGIMKSMQLMIVCIQARPATTLHRDADQHLGMPCARDHVTVRGSFLLNNGHALEQEFWSRRRKQTLDLSMDRNTAPQNVC